MIQSLLNNSISKTITVYAKTQTFTNGIAGEPTYTSVIKSVKGLYWKATGSKPNISDKFKEQVTACIIVNPYQLSESELTTDCKINVSGEGDYMLVYADNIAGQNRVLQINVKEWA